MGFKYATVFLVILQVCFEIISQCSDRKCLNVKFLTYEVKSHYYYYVVCKLVFVIHGKRKVETGI